MFFSFLFGVLSCEQRDFLIREKQWPTSCGTGNNFFFKEIIFVLA